MSSSSSFYNLLHLFIFLCKNMFLSRESKYMEISCNSFLVNTIHSLLLANSAPKLAIFARVAWDICIYFSLLIPLGIDLHF